MHSHAKSWLSSGFETTLVSLEAETATFRFSHTVMRMNERNFDLDLLALFRVRGLKRMSIRQAKIESPTLERDRQAFKSMREGLRRTGGVELTFDAHVHALPRRGRRTEPGYGTIFVYERDRPTAPMWMVFANGRVTVTRVLSPATLRSSDRWPAGRQLAGLQFVGLWQQSQRFLVAWPNEEWRQSGYASLVGAFRMTSSATAAESLRVCRWLLREARAFEDGLHKVLYRKRPINPMRALRLANRHLARYGPSTEEARAIAAAYPEAQPVSVHGMGADELPTTSLRE